MRILFLSHRPPFPPDKGDKIRSFHILQHLAQRHEVHLACPVDDPGDLAHVPELERRVRSVHTVRIDGLARHWRAAMALPGQRPISVATFHVAELQRKVDALIDTVDFDAVFAYSTAMADYVFRSRHAEGRLAGVLKLLDLIDVDSVKWRDYAAASRPPMAWIYRRESRTLADYEARVAKHFDRLFIVTPEEREVFPASALRHKIDVIANGVDLDYFQPRESPTGGPPRIVFTGVMNYRPNVDAVPGSCRRSGRRSAPLGLTPNSTSWAVDQRTRSRRWRQRRASTCSAMSPTYAATWQAPAACIAPLRIARGVQNKVLEAMAMSRPVVATPNALEGIAARRGVDALQAGDAGEFAQCVQRLLEDPALAASIGARGRVFVETHHRWELQLQRLDELLA